MKNLVLTLILLTLCSCSAGRVPIVPGEVPRQDKLSVSEIKQGQQAYAQLSQQYKLDTNLDNAARVRKIVQKLSNAASGTVGGNPWHVYIFKDDNFKNAAATRGNFIFVWTGILRATNDDNELATILAHEVSHVLAEHTIPTPGEQANRAISGTASTMTQAVLSQQGLGAFSGLLSQITGSLINAAIINPSSQRIETEADTVGLFLMAQAGYNPDGALRFWQNVSSDPSFGGGISFLSTHPSSEDRIVNIRNYLPAAEEVYRQNR